MSGKYAHELTELTELTDTDTMVIEDADAPSVLKRVSVRTLKSLFGSSGAVAPEEYIEDPGVSNPDWEVEGIPGGWRVRITSVAPNALWYCVQKYNVETEEYNDVHSFTASLQSQGSQKILYKDFEADDIMVPSFALFRLITIATDYTKSTASDTQTAWSLRSVAPDWTPSAPTLLTEGGYPEIIQTTAQKFLIKIKIQAADGERHYVDGYRVRTRQWEDDIENWGAWSIIPGIKSTVSNRPLIFYYEIQGDHFSRRSNVQIAAAAVAMAPSGHVGAWSTAQEVDPSTDATAPDVPSLTITKLALVFQVAFSAPARGEGDCPDWDHWVVQYRLNGGNATYVPSTVDGVVDTKAFYLMASTQTQAAAGDTFQFRAKAVDYAGNESAYCAWTSVLTAEQIAAAGLADNAVTADKVGEIALFGWQFAGAFSATDHNTVAWEAAAITLTDGTVYAINAGNTGDISALTYIYLDINISETAFQTTTTPATAVGAGKILIAVAKNVASGKKAEYQVFGGSGGRLALLTADNIAANTVTANEVAANTITASEISATAGLSGAQIHVTSATVFDSDVEIQGVLKSTGGIKTSAAGNDRIEIGAFAGAERIIFYNSGSIVSVITGDATGLLITGLINSGCIPPLDATKIQTGTFSTARIPNLSANKITSDTLAIARIPTMDSAHIPTIITHGLSLTGASGSMNVEQAYAVDGTQVVGNQGAAVADAGVIHGAELDDTAAALSDVQELRTQFNTLLARYRAAGGIDT